MHRSCLEDQLQQGPGDRERARGDLPTGPHLGKWMGPLTETWGDGHIIKSNQQFIQQLTFEWGYRSSFMGIQTRLKSMKTGSNMFIHFFGNSNNINIHQKSPISNHSRCNHDKTCNHGTAVWAGNRDIFFWRALEGNGGHICMTMA